MNTSKWTARDMAEIALVGDLCRSYLDTAIECYFLRGCSVSFV